MEPELFDPYICDDCGTAYAGPAYYTFEAEGCNDGDEPDSGPVNHRCTGNLCPDCTGPFMDPDEENDPRKAAVDFYDERLHANMGGVH